YLGGGAVLEAGYAFNRTTYHEQPQGWEPLYYTAAGKRGNWFRDARQSSVRHQFLVNAFARTLNWRGSHLVKGGADVSYIDYSQGIERNTYYHLRVDGSPIRKTEFLGPGALSRTSLMTSYYVQDSWRPRPNLQVEGGLRWDYDRLVRRINFAPRLSAAYSPARRPNMKISGGFGLIYDVPNLQLFVRPLDQIPVVTYFAGDGSVARGPVAALFDLVNLGLNSPAFWTYTVGWEQRFASNLSFAMNYLGKRGLSGLAFIPTFEPNDSSYQLANQRQDRVDSAEFTVRQTFRRQYAWMASYVRSSARSNAAVDITVDDPQNIANNSGPLSWDAPHRLLSWGYLPTFWKSWAVAYLVEYRSGFPFSIVQEDGFLAGPANSRRFPNFLEANIHAELKVSLFHHRWALRGGFNNLTGRRNPTVVNPMMGAPQFMTFYGGYGRAANFRIRWLGHD
ncbi:MAG: TonB-dependent receptor, partial [Acidobacteria bacterium]|nr:TonB-dependent receptor [Acidobacteriota bacterium]